MVSDTCGTLVVDPDGTLLRSDMLHESFWSAAGRDWRSLFSAAVALWSGRAALKRSLATAAGIDPATLPYDEEVIAHVRAWRSRGGRTALVTAGDEILARAIADHLGIFDEVHGSNASLNLKGERKAKFVEERFGAEGFVYMGNNAADSPVWERAGKVITVNAPAALRRNAERVSADVEHLSTFKPEFGNYLKALRPHQWMKNVLVFLPMLAAHRLNAETFVLALLAFATFGFFSSSVYILNDFIDLSADRAHPRKKVRAFASGRVPMSHGTRMAAALILLGTVFAVALGWKFALVMLSYFLLATAYSLHLKRRIVIDIFTLAGLYSIRIVAGGVATEIPLSVWLLTFSAFFFLALAAVKRQTELIDMAKRGVPMASGRGYHVDDLPIISMIAIGAGYVSVLVLAFYVNSPAVLELYSRPQALWGVCAVQAYWITRTVMVAHRGAMHDDPIIYAAGDRTSQVCLGFVFAFILAGMVG